MYFSTVYEWLDWIVNIHKLEVDLGLTRIKQVAKKMGVCELKCPVIIVGGTNGKGSTVAGIESIYQTAGYRVGSFTSPILFKHNEYVRILGKNPDDNNFCQAYAYVEAKREQITLTPFEFYTLGALYIFKQHSLDLIILEVGLGGRLDAVNIIDADLAILTNISLDHTDRLGTTREAIGYEKAGILRSKAPAICGDFNPPQTILDAERKLPTKIYYQGRDFHFQEKNSGWSWQSQKSQFSELPATSLAKENMSVVLMAVELMQKFLPVDKEIIYQGLKRATLPGRIQIFKGEVTTIIDVAHNPQSVAMLADRLENMPIKGQTFAVFSMLKDKDIEGSIRYIKHLINEWLIAPLSLERGATLDKLQTAMVNIKQTSSFKNIRDAYRAAILKARVGDRIVIFGSFHTISEVWPDLNCVA